MKYYSERYGCLKIRTAAYGNDGRLELHVAIVNEGTIAGIGVQARQMAEALEKETSICCSRSVVPVMIRAYVSDPTNQGDIVMMEFSRFSCPVSVIGQAPLNDNGKIAILAVFVEDADVRHCADGSYLICRGEYSDFRIPLRAAPGNTHAATSELLHSAAKAMEREDFDFAMDCLRTWFYVRDIDNRYMGMVKARNEFFKSIGLTRDTHFIASTGIEGKNSDPHTVVSFEALATKGLKQGQIRYLKGSSHLNPTAEYGVAFERGTAVDYGDRRNIFISGTASIDNRGEIVAPGDIEGQCRRMAENVMVLLAEAGAAKEDICHIVVYVRDIADSDYVRDFMGADFPEIPCIVVLGPVCRPGWLVEMETMAVVPVSNSVYAPY